MCVARWQEGAYSVAPPKLVGDLGSFWARLRHEAPDGPILIGFDFPIGLPAVYAANAGVDGFPEALARFGSDAWARFYDVCETASEISVRRPFYPYRPGGTKRAHLLDGLGLASGNDLLRWCDQATETRGPASPLFWTLGGKQVGKAAIIGWRDLLAPGLRDDALGLRLWPFHGPLDTLLEGNAIVVAETYPAEACIHLGLSPPGGAWSKTSQEGRQRQSAPLLTWAKQRGVHLDDVLAAMIDDGFGDRKDGEDPFDATVGLFGMLEVALGHRRANVPDSSAVQRVEGWIFGQDVSSSRANKRSTQEKHVSEDGATLHPHPPSRAMSSPARIIDLSTWPRRGAFEYFRALDNPFFNITCPLDVSRLVPYCKMAGHPFSLAALYLSLRVANEYAPFRLRIEGEHVVAYDEVQGSRTVLVGDEQLAFTYIDYDPSFAVFRRRAERAQRVAQANPGEIDARVGQTDLIHYSVLPWISFTSISHARSWRTGDSVPKITFGGYRREGEHIQMPVSVEVHHGLMDGLHVARFLERLQGYFDEPDAGLAGA
ncbi:MAG: CatA-like O-acetyltransferase [Bacteroidota bacterium]